MDEPLPPRNPGADFSNPPGQLPKPKGLTPSPGPRPPNWEPLNNEQEILHRLEKQNVPPPPAPAAAEPEKPLPPPAERSWAPVDVSKLDLSKGRITHGLSQYKATDFAKKISRKIATDLGRTFMDIDKRQEFGQDMAKLRHHGLSGGKVYKQIKDWEKRGDLKPWQARKLRRDFGVKRPSSLL